MSSCKIEHKVEYNRTPYSKRGRENAVDNDYEDVSLFFEPYPKIHK